jgi:hypothetical protein
VRSVGRANGLTRLAGPGLAIVACIVLLGANAPTTPAIDLGAHLIDAPTPGSAGGGGVLANIVPLLVIALVVGVVVAAGAAYVLFRTRGTPVAPASDEWWTCSNCGAGNVVGSARCHACSTWRASTPRPTPSASP